MRNKFNNHEIHRIAYFVTAHGFGHASRSCGVMQAILEKNPQKQFEIFTEVPKWFFTDSLKKDVGYHRIKTDIGMVQTSPFQGDLDATIDNLRQFLPLSSRSITNIANTIRQLNCSLIICDISPLGIAVAAEAGIPSVLIENFTWDWIYSGYQFEIEKFTPYIKYLKKLYKGATYHIKTEPFCQSDYSNLTVAPISRKPRNKTKAIRTKLGLGNDEKIVIITMGGIRDRKDYGSSLERHNGVHFIIPGAGDKLNRQGNLTFLPHRSDYFHPDLINAADIVIGKAGYSTIAEVYQSGKPFGYVSRPCFRETDSLVNFIKEHLKGLPISIEELSNQTWLKKIPQLLAIPKDNQKKRNGADEIADFVLELLRR
jgi:hypothetical protein